MGYFVLSFSAPYGITTLNLRYTVAIYLPKKSTIPIDLHAYKLLLLLSDCKFVPHPQFPYVHLFSVNVFVIVFDHVPQFRPHLVTIQICELNENVKSALVPGQPLHVAVCRCEFVFSQAFG